MTKNRNVMVICVLEDNSTLVLERDPDVIQFSEPNEEDGAAMWEMVHDIGALDENSSYSYIMLGKFFSETCVVAKSGEDVVGFVTAFCPPTEPDVVFVWQVAVDKSQRGKGFGKTLLKELLKRVGCEDVKYLEATISPSNKPSQALFCGMAGDLNTNCEISEFFSEELFPGEGHEAEMKYRIGPFETDEIK